MGWRVISALLVSFLPSALFLAFVRSQARQEPRAWPPIALAFVLGMIAAAMAFFIFENLEGFEAYHALISGAASTTAIEKAVFFFAVAAPIEELLKLTAAVTITPFFGPLPNPLNAFVLVIAAALGFASAENWYAMWATGGPDLGRAAIVPFMHMIFSALCGWGLAESTKRKGRSGPVYLGLFLASTYHGLFNFLEYMGGLWHFATFPLVGILWFFLSWSLRLFAKSAAKRL